MASIHERIMDAVVAAAAAAALPGIGDRVYRSKIPDRAAKQFPCLIVSIENVRPEVAALTTEADEWVLPVQLLLASRGDIRDSADLPAWLAWQEAVIAAFLMQLPAAVPEAWDAPVRPMDAIDAARIVGPEYMAQTSGYVIAPRVVVPRVRPG